MGLTSTFSIATRGLQMAQAYMEVISHNIANVNTEGYSRQRMNLSTTDPYATAWGAMGTGVTADNIVRMYDRYVDNSLVETSSEAAKYEAQKISMDAIESIFNEALGNGINEALSDFWNAWQEVADNPEGNPERMNLLEKADTLASTINQMRRQMDAIKTDLNRQTEESIVQVNNLIREIADLNAKIVPLEAGANDQANDLRDQRQLKIKELAEYIDINYFEDPADGTMTVITPKGTPLVMSGSSWSISAAADDQGDIHIMWERGNGGQVDISDYVENGKIGGWIELRDQKMDEFYTLFDDFTEALIREVNRQCSQGAGLENFTDLTSTYDIQNYAKSVIEFPGDENDILLTAVNAGSSGDKICYVIQKAATPNSDLTLNAATDAAGVTTITITLATDAANNVASRASDVVEAINADNAPFRPGWYVEADLVAGEGGESLVTDTSAPLYLTLAGGDYATLTTTFGGDADLTFTAVDMGLYGEAVGIEYVDPELADQSLKVSVVDNVVKVYLATNATGVVTSTADEIRNAITASPQASALVTVAGPPPVGADVVSETIPPVFLNRSLQDLLVFGNEIAAAFPEAASLETSLDGEDNDLVFTAVVDGEPGDGVSIRYVNPAAAGSALAVTTDVAGKSITISLATDASGKVTTTAKDILEYINYEQVDPEAAEARTLVTVSLASGNSGEGLIPNVANPMEPQYLDRSTSFQIVTYNAEGAPTFNTIKVNPGDTREDIVAQIDDIPGLACGIQTISGENYIHIKADAGYEYAFANDSSSALMALGLNTFFEGYDTLTIKVNDVITDDLNMIAAAKVDASGYVDHGDNSNALDVADVKDQRFRIGDLIGTISDANNTLEAVVGASSYAVTRSYDFNLSLVTQIEARRDQVSAVNLDEEVAELLKFQYMYQASAKLISVTDELLATLMGIK
ncbi:MAG: flagellar hook-associated protein FlgK [Proteobacteria bacterium]|nr:flagellar hook-associated protein FlgK [Pseudomonadota bacterium]